jgi:choline kinase
MNTRVAVILAAGVGSRLRPLTDDRPKALVEVRGKSLLHRAVDQLVQRGVTRLVVASGYRAEALEAALRDAPLEVVFRPNPRYETTQNSVSLALCRDAVEGHDFFRLDGDVVFDPLVLDRLEAVEGPLVAAVDRKPGLDAEAMKVLLGRAPGTIAAFGKGIPLSEAAGESIGIERITASAAPALFDALDRAGRAGEVSLYYEDIYARLIDAGQVVKMADVTGVRWCEVDSIDDLRRAESVFAG